MNEAPRPAVGLLAPCEIRWISQDLGCGIFAKELIPRHTLLWRYLPENIREFTPVEFLALIDSLPSDAARIRLLRTAYGWNGKMVMPLDDSAYWNHSTNPNCATGEDGSNNTYALRDILPSEELLDNYLTFEYPQWLIDLYVRFDIDTSFLWPAKPR